MIRTLRFSAPASQSSVSMMRLLILFGITLLTIMTTSQDIIGFCSANDFDPYIMNGGLLSAIAGRDYIIMATDTRMIGASGYDILSRYHISSRIWSPINIMSSSSSSSLSSSSSTTTTTKSDHINNNIWAPDGSININLQEEIRNIQQQQEASSSSSESSLRLLRESIIPLQPASNTKTMIMIGSVGCQIDNEQFKRNIRSELRTAYYFNEVTTSRSYHYSNQFQSVFGTTEIPSISINSIAVLLSQVLYSRRTFPYGCYCILGGLASFSLSNYDDGMSSSINGEIGGGQVYVYDAIGSYENVAIACTGTGFELLQPILDRQFHPYTPAEVKATTTDTTTTTSSRRILQRRPVATQVDCPTVEEAIQKLLRAYRSVAEREIGIGDHILFTSIQLVQHSQQKSNDKNNDNNDDQVNDDDGTSDTKVELHPSVTSNTDDSHYDVSADTQKQQSSSQKMVYQSRIWTAPLKKH